MNTQSFENDSQVKDYLYTITEIFYEFATLYTEPQNSAGYQLMPQNTDQGFFHWYTRRMPNNQFFKTKEMCVLYFVLYWIEWDRKGRPTGNLITRNGERVLDL